MICGNEVPIPRKRLEFEIGYQLINRLSDIVVFKHQENIMNYHADFLLELKNNHNRDIPSIVIEIDEDRHDDRDPEMEKFRQNVIEYFNNRFIRIPVKRNASQEEINKIVNDSVNRIRDLSTELILEYTLDINEDDFIKQVEDHNIDKAFIKKFLNGNSGDKVFKYTHQEIGEFLGYPKTDNYHCLRMAIKGTARNPSVFVEGIDWKVACNLSCKQLSKKSGNEGNGGHNVLTYLITRTTFNRLCINAHRKPRAKQVAHFFAVVYEVAVSYVQRLRAKNVESGVNTRSSHEQVKERINQLVNQNVKKTSMYKISTELEELKNKFNEMKNERDKCMDELMEKNKSIKDLQEKVGSYSQLDLEKTLELEKLKKNNSNLKIKYRNSKTNLKTTILEKNDIVEQLENYIDENKNLKKIVKKYKQEKELKKLVEKDSESDSEINIVQSKVVEPKVEKGKVVQSKVEKGKVVEPKVETGKVVQSKVV